MHKCGYIENAINILNGLLRIGFRIISIDTKWKAFDRIQIIKPSSFTVRSELDFFFLNRTSHFQFEVRIKHSISSNFKEAVFSLK